MRRAFTLIELLVVIAVIGVLLGILIPALSTAREAGRGAVCLSNLRQDFIACRAYADDYKGLSPAIGVPYASLPNWALVVQSFGGARGESSTELYASRVSLVCPTSRAKLGPGMQRTYAMNAAGHAGLPGDKDNYDIEPAFINLDKIERPHDAMLLVDSAPTPVTADSPPPTRTASMIDLRQPEHVSIRLARPHAAGRFQAATCDGAAAVYRDVPSAWMDPLP